MTRQRAIQLALLHTPPYISSICSNVHFSSSSFQKIVVPPSSVQPAQQRASVPSISDRLNDPILGCREQAFPVRHPPMGTVSNRFVQLQGCGGGGQG